jgi:DNA damage-binding protein 1
VVTTFSIIASVVGASLPIETVLVLGFANLIADAISMGAGDFLSSKAEFAYQLAEQERSGKLLTDGRSGEVVASLVRKGLTQEDAQEMMTILSQPAYHAFATEFVLVEELGQEVPDDPWVPAKDGAVMFTSFLVFGSLPLWVYVITFAAKYNDAHGTLGISAASCAMSIFALGWLQGTIAKQPRLRAALYMMINGAMASAATYLLSWGITAALGGNGTEKC